MTTNPPPDQTPPSGEGDDPLGDAIEILLNGAAGYDPIDCCKRAIQQLEKAHSPTLALRAAERALTYCECPEEGELVRGMSDRYDSETELPFVQHQPGECKCTNELRKYRRGNIILTLCSCCNLSSDVPVAEPPLVLPPDYPPIPTVQGAFDEKDSEGITVAQLNRAASHVGFSAVAREIHMFLYATSEEGRREFFNLIDDLRP